MEVTLAAKIRIGKYLFETFKLFKVCPTLLDRTYIVYSYKGLVI